MTIKLENAEKRWVVSVNGSQVSRDGENDNRITNEDGLGALESAS